MQHFRRGAALLASLSALVIPLVGCGSKGGGSLGGSSSASLSGSDSVASVDGQPITQSLFFSQLQNFVANPQALPTPQQVGRLVLGQLIQGRVIEDYAKQQNALPTDAEVNTYYNNYKMVQEAKITETFEQYLQDNGVTPDEFKNDQIKPQLAAFKLQTKGMTVSDADAKAYYDLHRDKFTIPAAVHIKRLVFSDQADARQAYDQIKGGKKLEEFVPRSLAKEPPDGDLKQWLPTDATQTPQLSPLSKAVQGLRAGGVTPPFQFEGQWWVAQVVATRPKQVLPENQIADLVKQQALTDKIQQNPQVSAALSQQIRDFQTKLANDGKITITLPGQQYVQLLNDLKNPPVAPPAGLGAVPPTGARPVPTPARPTPAPARR